MTIKSGIYACSNKRCRLYRIEKQKATPTEIRQATGRPATCSCGTVLTLKRIVDTEVLPAPTGCRI